MTDSERVELMMLSSSSNDVISSSFSTAKAELSTWYGVQCMYHNYVIGTAIAEHRPK